MWTKSPKKQLLLFLNVSILLPYKHLSSQLKFNKSYDYIYIRDWNMFSLVNFEEYNAEHWLKGQEWESYAKLS